MITIKPIKCDGRFWVEIVMDNCPMESHGPFDKDEAEAMANQFAGVCAVLHQPATIGRRHGQRATRRRA